MATLDEVLQALAELNTTIKDHRDDPATVDMEVLEAALKDIMSNLAPLQRRGMSGGEVPPAGGGFDPAQRAYRQATLRRSPSMRDRGTHRQ